MAQIVSIILNAVDRKRLEEIAGDRSRLLKHIQRANIILLSACRLSVLDVARRAGVSRPAVWRWQQRYGEEGVDGLLRDKTRKPGRAPLSTEIVAKVLVLTEKTRVCQLSEPNYLEYFVRMKAGTRPRLAFSLLLQLRFPILERPSQLRP